MSWKKIKRISACVCSGAFLMQLGGCNVTELEDRTFPMLAAVDYDTEKEDVGVSCVFPILRQEPDAAEESGDTHVAMVFSGDFVSAWDNYESSLNKTADYNHLKVFLMSESFIGNEEQYGNMLTMIQEEETFPRNTYVCVTDDVEAVLKAEEAISEDLGTYIEELLESHEYDRDGDLPTLGKLVDEKENQRKIYEIPYLTVEADTILWSGYYEK